MKPTLPCFTACFAAAFFGILPSISSATEGVVDTPVANSGSHLVEEGYPTFIDFEVSRRAMWCQLYLQREGRLVFTRWIRRDEIISEGPTTLLFLFDSLEVGEHKVWVRAWEPEFGTSNWSEPVDLIVDCSLVRKCAPIYPTESNPVAEGYWPAEYQFNATERRNRTATWGQLEVKSEEDSFDNPLATISAWVEYDFPGQNGVGLEQISGLRSFLSDGNYDWRCREYSVCAGIGDWSETEACDLSRTNCDGPTSPPNLSFDNELHLYHAATLTAGAGNIPAIVTDFRGFTWMNLYINDAASGRVFFNQWIQFTDEAIINELLPKLPPGGYEIWARSYHDQCGIGPWGEAPRLEFSVADSEGLNGGYFTRGIRIDQRGIGFGTFVPAPGIDWYQIYITCGSRVMMNQWVDVEDRTPDENGVYQLSYNGSPTSNHVAELNTACGATVKAWVRGYSMTGEYGPWVEEPLPAEPAFDGVAPQNLISDSTELRWTTSGQNSGYYEVYVTLNGKLYFTDQVEAVLTSLGRSSSGFDDEWDLPRVYRPFFRMSSTGEIRMWVRNVCGESVGAWSEPRDWSEITEEPPEEE